MNMQKYFVSRQTYWPDGENVVEVSVGGSDYANPDMLCVRYANEGEGEEFDNPKEAAAAAIEICKKWRVDNQPDAQVAYGCTGGMTMPFEGCTFEELESWAKEKYDTLDRCPRCGEILGKEKWSAGMFTSDGDLISFEEFEYCSQYCAEESSVQCEDDENDGEEEEEEV